MKGNTMNITTPIIVPLALGLVCAGIVAATLAGKTLPLISSPRAALIALLVIGMAACAGGGIGQVAASGRWFSPLAIMGYLLGLAILIVVISVFAGWKLPLVETPSQAVVAVAGLMMVKFLIGLPSFFFHWL